MAQDGLETNDVWRQIPPEEKLALMAKAQSKAVTAMIIVVIVGSTLALSLKIPWALWASIIFSPLVFHAVSTKAWKGMRPKLLLEYLAARSAARRYAFSYRSKELTLRLLMRGSYTELVVAQNKEDESQAALETALNTSVDVWIALFGDCLVVMQEQRGGAEVKFAHLLNTKLACTIASPSGNEYSTDSEVVLSESDSTGKKRTVKLTSLYPAALVVLAKRVQMGIAETAKKTVAIEAPVEEEASDGDDLLFGH